VSLSTPSIGFSAGKCSLSASLQAKNNTQLISIAFWILKAATADWLKHFGPRSLYDFAFVKEKRNQ